MPFPDSPTRVPFPDRVAAARRAFEAAFARAPTHAAAAPGRANVIGDHVDYAGGPVLPMAIARSCLALAARDPSRDTLRIRSENLNDQIEIEPSSGGRCGVRVPTASWAAYPLGAATELRASYPGVNLAGLDILLASDVPIGAGLASSAAISVSTAMVLSSLFGLQPVPLQLARLCQRAEHRHAGTPCGLMDQAAATLSRDGSLLLFDCRDESARHIPLPPDAAFIIIDTHVHHQLATSAYAQRRNAADAAARALKVPTLRDADRAAHAAAIESLPAAPRDAARHIVSEIARVQAAARALADADLPRLGALMCQSHASLRDVYRVSCPELDAVVDAALACPGVHGARMTGAGFGGAAIALLDAAHAADFEHTFRDTLGARAKPYPTLDHARPARAASVINIATTPTA